MIAAVLQPAMFRPEAETRLASEASGVDPILGEVDR